MSLSDLSKIVVESVWFYVALAVIMILVVLLIVRKNTRKAIKKKLETLQYRYSSAKSIPLAFKMNKATALARVNPDVETVIKENQPIFDQTQDDIKTLSELLNMTDDLLATGSFSDAKKNNADIETLLSKTEEEITTVNTALENVLKQETEQREQINVLKEEFRKIKIEYNENSNNYIYAYESIEGKILEVEKLFSSFEEWMYVSDFQKANETKEEIVKRIAYIKTLYDKLPTLITMARTLVPKSIENLANTHAIAKQRGVYLKHLDLARNIDLINDSMRSDLNSLKNAEIKGVEEHLTDCLTRLKQLKDQIDNEVKAFNQIPEVSKDTFEEVSKVSLMLTNMQKTYKSASSHFGFDNLDEKINGYTEMVDSFEEKANELKKQIKENKSPSTGIIIGCRELKQDMQIRCGQLKDTKEQLDKACQEENNARTQLLKLHLIMNEMSSKVRKHRLVSISENYEADVLTAQHYINELEDLLSESPLRIGILTSTLKEAIDFVYTLYNNVNKILGTASMVEVAIVVGNRCRSFYSEVDSQLSRSEMSYRNGEYTKALQESFKAIEKIYPNQVESIIKANSQRGTL